MTRRRHAALPPAALEDDDLLRKIFLLLPPQPSSLPRLSAVCKLWRDVVTDPQFLRGFREHHRKPPVLGLLMGYTGFPYFRSVRDPPDHIPDERFFPPSILNLYMDLFDCRHGRVLFYDRERHKIFVWDPATRDRRCVVVPPLFDEKEVGVYSGAFVCAACDEGHVHGDCHSSPFQVVLIGIGDGYKRAFASVYSSETGTWSDIVSTANHPMYDLRRPSVLVGNAVCWLFEGDERGILVFDLARQSIANIKMPHNLGYYRYSKLQVTVAEDGCIGLAILSYDIFALWERKVSCDGVAKWVLQKSVKLNTILGLGPVGGGDNLIVGYDEDDHVIYIRTDIGVCMVQLESMQFKNLGEDNFTSTVYFPYRSFYAAVSDLAICERTGGISAPLAKDDMCIAAVSLGIGGVGGNDAAASNGGTSQ